jgi:hypothetical protein
MANRLKWMRTALTGLMGLLLFSAPQLAMAGEHCDRQNYSRANRNYNGDDDRGYGYRREYYQDYRERGYRDAGYRDDRYNGYYGNYRSDQGYYRDGYGDYRPSRSTGKSAAIIGGSAAAGAVVGGLAGGRKGAIIGGVVGGIGGLVYDRSTKNGGPRW